jgi:hypothetical protein
MPATELRCTLLSHSTSSHLAQIYAGFALLHRLGALRLTQQLRKVPRIDPTKPHHLRDAAHAHLTVLVNDGLRVHYDTHDSWEIHEEWAEQSTVYFKRSYDTEKIPPRFRAKVFPLGLNYELYAGSWDRFEWSRALRLNPWVRRLKWLARRAAAVAGAPWAYRPVSRAMYAVPDRAREPRVLFMTQTWDPAEFPDMTPDKVEERVRMNEARAECIDRLRREFGDRFLGGFKHTPHALAQNKQHLIPDGALSGKGNFIKILRSYPICVTTTGLHNSIGWKLAEYVAFSRAIVTERLHYQVPGDFAAGKNYLEFVGPEECVRAVSLLMSDAKLRGRMMDANFAYYASHVRADVLVMNSLLVALRVACGASSPLSPGGRGE